MNCKKCGNVLDPSDTVCKICGEPVNAVADVQQPAAAPVQPAPAPVAQPAQPPPAPVQPAQPVPPVAPQQPMMQQPMQQPVYGQPAYGPAPVAPQQKSPVFLIIIILLILAVLGLGGFIIAKNVLGDNDTKETDKKDNKKTSDKEKEKEKEKDKDKDEDEDEDEDNPKDDDIIARGNTYKYKGFEFTIPSGYDAGVENGYFNILDETNKVQVIFSITSGYILEDLTGQEETMKESYADSGIIASSYSYKTFGGTKWLVFNISIDGIPATDCYTSLGSYNLIEAAVINAGTKSQDTVMNEVTNMIKSATYNGSKNFAAGDNQKSELKVIQGSKINNRFK